MSNTFITAEHRFRRTEDGKPLRKTFPLKVWKMMPQGSFNGQLYPNQGWQPAKSIVAEFTPSESLNDKKPKGNDFPELGEGFDTLKERILSGEDKITGEEIKGYIKTNEIDINPNQIKSKLIEALKIYWNE